MERSTTKTSPWLLLGLVLSGPAVVALMRVGLAILQETSYPLWFGRDLGGDSGEVFPQKGWPIVLGAAVFAAGLALAYLLVRAGQGSRPVRVAAALAVAGVTLAVVVGTRHRIDVDGPRCGVRTYTGTTHCISDGRSFALDAVVPAIPGIAASGLLLFAPSSGQGATRRPCDAELGDRVLR